MVVMDWVDGKTAHETETEKNEWPRDAQDQIRKALETLHKAGFVFGDLRHPNIMFQGDKALFIDFDWSGPAGKVLYPRHLSGKVKWPEGAGDFEPITKEHDHAMADKFFKVESDDIRCNCGP